MCASGYYPYIRANLVAFSAQGVPAGTLTALYSGTSSTSGCPKGTYNPAQDFTRIAFPPGSPDTNASAALNTPYGNSYGTLYVFSSDLHSGGSISVTSLGSSISTTLQGYSGLSTLASQSLNTNVVQWFQVPLPIFSTPQIEVNFTSGGTSSGNFYAFVVFGQPPEDLGSLGSHITTATNTAVKVGAGTIFSLTVNQVGLCRRARYDLRWNYQRHMRRHCNRDHRSERDSGTILV